MAVLSWPARQSRSVTHLIGLMVLGSRRRSPVRSCRYCHHHRTTGCTMNENNASTSAVDNLVSELEKLKVSTLDTEWSTQPKEVNKTYASQVSTSKQDLDIEAKLSELQCPFTWQLPRTGIECSDLVSKLTEKVKEIEDDDEFEFRKFVCNIVIVYELCTDGKLDEANKKLTSLLSFLADLYKNCKEPFFIAMKRPLQHITLSYKAHLLKAYSDRLSAQQTHLYYSRMDKILAAVYPFSEMTDSEKAGIYGFKAQVFTEYSYSGTVSALEYAKQAIELDLQQAEWHFLAGKILGRIRRCANWNDYVKKEELNLLEQAVELHEKPAFMVFLACAYIECTRSIYRNLNVDKELSQKLNKMNSRAKELFTRCLDLKPSCSHIYIRCANGMIKLPKPFVDKDVVEKCIEFSLEKAPNNGMAHHVAGMFAERHKYDIEMAMYHYKISSDLCVFGATADYIRLKYTYDKNFDLLSALEKMLNNTEALPNKHNTLSCIGSYYLFLKRDLITALEKYGQIMDADPDSSALKAHKPVFLNMKTPLNMYEILCTEVHSELSKDNLAKEDRSLLKDFENKLNKFDPTLSEKFAGEPSRIQEIMEEAVVLTERYKGIVNKQQRYNRKDSGTYQSNAGSSLRGTGNRGRGRGRGGQQNVRRQSNPNASMSWRNRSNDAEDSELVEASGESVTDSTSTANHNINHAKRHDNFSNYLRPSGKARTVSNGNNENEDPVAHKEFDAECKSIQKFQKNRSVQTVRDPYGPNEGGVQKSFERKRIPDKKWATKYTSEFE